MRCSRLSGGTGGLSLGTRDHRSLQLRRTGVGAGSRLAAGRHGQPLPGCGAPSRAPTRAAAVMHMPPGAPERRWQQAAANGPTKARAPPRRAGPGAPATLGHPHRDGGGPRGSGRAGASPPPEPGPGSLGAAFPNFPAFKPPPKPRGRPESRTGLRHGASGQSVPSPDSGSRPGHEPPFKPRRSDPAASQDRGGFAGGASCCGLASCREGESDSEFSATPGRLSSRRSRPWPQVTGDTPPSR